MPEGDRELELQGLRVAAPTESRAVLRLRIEHLLRSREPAPLEQWLALGPEGVHVLLDLLDEPGTGDDLRHTAIVTLGRLEQPLLAERLGPMLLNDEESALTRTYVASALGRLGGDRAAVWLGRAVGDPDDMVRLQLARSLRRVGTKASLPFLRSLARDRATAVAKAAESALAGGGSTPPTETPRPEPVKPGLELRAAPETEAKRGPIVPILLGIAIGLLAGGYALWLLLRADHGRTGAEGLQVGLSSLLAIAAAIATVAAWLLRHGRREKGGGTRH